MAILSNSRYQFSTIDFLQKDTKGPINPIIFYENDSLTNVSFVLHIYAEKETLHQLSWRYYNRPDFWWAIVEYNPEITDFFNITPGVRLRIPRV